MIRHKYQVLLRCLRKLRRHQIFIGYPLGQLSGFLQDVLQQLEAVFLKHGVVLPGVLGFVTVHDDREFIQGRFLELGLDGLGDLLGGVGVDVIHAFLDGIERRGLIWGAACKCRSDTVEAQIVISK